MKKSIRNLILGAVMTAGVFAASTTAFASVTKFVQEDMNFRFGPGVTSTVIGSVPAGAQVEILGLEGEWDRINYNGTIGYIHTGNVADTFTVKQTIAPAPVQQTTTPQTVSSVQTYYDTNWSKAAQAIENSIEWKSVSVNTGYLALRSEPAYEDANIIGQLGNGDTVQVIGAACGSYVEVFCPKYATCGWVNAGFLR